MDRFVLTTSLPLVSIGIPCYNYAHYIAATMDSVAGQTYPNIEMIIVDDVSTDDSVSVIEKWIKGYTGSFKVKLIRNKKNLGLTGVCNVILNNCRGKYFQTLDADDIILPGKIERQVKLLEAAGDACFIYSNISVIDASGQLTNDDYLGSIHYDDSNMPSGMIHNDLLKFNFIPLPSVLIHTGMAKESGGYNEGVQVQDYYLWLLLSRTHKVLYDKEQTALYRLHQLSMSNNDASNARSVESVLEIKYAYYPEASPENKAVIRKNIAMSSAYLYEHNSKMAALWIKRNAVLNPGVKSYFYYAAMKFGIPFSFIKKIRSLIGK